MPTTPISRKDYPTLAEYHKALNKRRNEKSPAYLKGQKLYEEAMKSGREVRGASGPAVATETGLKLKTDLPPSVRTAPGAISPDQMTPTSYETLGQMAQEQAYQDTLNVASELGLDENAPTDLEKFVKKQIEAQKAKQRSEQLSLEQQRRELRAAAGEVQGASAANQAMVTSSLTGPQANAALRAGIASDARTRLGTLRMSGEQLALYDTQLKAAQAAGNLELAQSIQAERDSYVNQAIQNDVLATQAESQQQADMRANLSAFQGLVDSGQELGVETISQFAQGLNLPFEAAYGYYQGAQAIRDDKTLDLATKETELAQLNQDLQDQINGITTEEAKKIDYLTKQTQQWAEMGYSQAEIQEMRSNMRTMLGIEDQSDPAYQAELAYKNAQIAYSNSNTSVNYQDLLTKQLEYAQSMGYTGEAYIPNSTRGGLYNVATYTSEDGSTGVQILNKDGKPLAEGDYGGQCGKFVNDLFGVDMFGDDYNADKLSKVDFSVTVPAPGMAITWPTQGLSAPYGHVVYVTGVDAENQVVNYVDSNGDGESEKVGYGSITFQELGQLISEKKGGLIVNPNSKVEGGRGGAQPFTYQSYYDDAVSQGMSSENAEKYASNMLSSASSFKNETSQKNYVIYSVLNDENKTYADAVSSLSDAELQDYADKNGYFSRQLVNLDPDSTMSNAVIDELIEDQATRNLIRNQQRWIGAKLRGESGAAITVGEYLTEAQKYFPTGSDTADSIKGLQSKRDFYTQSLKNGLDEYGKKLVWEAEQSVAKEEENLDPFSLADEYDPFTYSIYSEYGIE